MSTVSTTNTRQRVPLKSIERSFVLSDDAWFMVTHVLLVKGQTNELLKHLPVAVMKTFNRHPRMRIKMVKEDPDLAEIQPLLTVEDVAAEGVLEVKETNADGLSDAAYQAFVQERIRQPFDRFKQFTFKLHVWRDAANDQARLILFSDHYQSDGNSGFTIFNDVLSFAAELSHDANTSVAVEEMALRPSLYDLVLGGHQLMAPALRAVVKAGVRALLKLSPVFTHLIKPNDQQEDFRMPNPPKNLSTVLFAEGSKENLAKIVAKCREEGTTFFGALAAAIFTSYIVASDSTEDAAFKMSVFMNFNMRHRVSEPVDPQAVGCFITASEMPTPAINVPAQRFWDLARLMKKQSTETVDSFPTIAVPLILLDQHFNRESDKTLYEQFPIKAANLGDVDISSVGRYPYTTSHSFASGEMTLESLQYSGHVPFLGTVAYFYATSLHQVGYSISHHYEEVMGKKLFETAVAVMERSWAIGGEETLGDAIHKIVKQQPREETPEAASA